MPKAPQKKTNSVAKDAADPISRRTSKDTDSSSRRSSKDPKLSHLYTDDNPETTIHGTGFKDEAAAKTTFDLISKRSLLYQFQTVNTMWHRANGHPHKTKNMEAAMKLFREWLDVTYPEATAKLRAKGFKPLLSKNCVKKYLPRIRECKLDGMDKALEFAEKYVDLAPRKKLANVLFDNGQPKEPDMEKVRYDTLDKLVEDGKEISGGWENEEVWEEKKKVTDEVVRLIAWAWCPIQERSLP